MTIPIGIHYPIPKNARGDAFASLEAALAHLQGEVKGGFQIGHNTLWHGGIHLTHATTPWCALSGSSPQEAAEFPIAYKGEQPLRCMADGEVAAFRVQRDYLAAPWLGQTLHYSGSFVLIRHRYQAGDTDRSALTFYTLYMHLAPWSAYEVARSRPQTYRVQEKVGLSAYADRLRSRRLGTVPQGTRLAWNCHNPGLTVLTDTGRKYGCVTLLDGVSGVGALAKDENVWLLADNGNLKVLEQETAPPGWMANWQPPLTAALPFDRVVNVTEPCPIKAGEAIGHLGFYRTPTRAGTHSEYRVHIELICQDVNLETFLGNPEQLTVGKKFLKYEPGRTRYEQDPETQRFEPLAQPTRSTGIVTLTKVPTLKDQDGNLFYQVRNEVCWLAQQDIKQLSQNDLSALGFTLVKSQVDTLAHLDGQTRPSSFIRQLLQLLQRAAQQDQRLTHALVPLNYQRLLNGIDRQEDGDYSPDEYRLAIQNPNLRDTLYRLVTQHISEWYYQSHDSIWSRMQEKMQRLASEQAIYNQHVIDHLSWMRQVPAFSGNPVVWHMHPVVFLDNLKIDNKKCFCFEQGIIDSPCHEGKNDINNHDYELLAKELGVEKEVLMAIAVVETGDKPPFREYIPNVKHATILYERHYMKRLLLKKGVAIENIRQYEINEPTIVHSYESNYKYGSMNVQYARLVRAREIDHDAANMSCSWGKFQVMGEYYKNLYKSIADLVDAQNYCAMQHLQYFNSFLVQEKNMLIDMKKKRWLSIAEKYNGKGQKGYDKLLKIAYEKLIKEG